MILGNYFLLEYPPDKLDKIELNKKLDFKWNSKMVEKLEKTKEFYKKKRGVQQFRERQQRELHAFLFDFSPYYQGLLNLKKDSTFIRINNIIKDVKEENNCCELIDIETVKKYTNKELKNIKFNKIMSNMIDNEIRKKIENKSYCDILEELYLSYLCLIEKLYDYLEKNGTFYFAFYFQPCDKKYVEIIYLLSLLFEKVIIMGGFEFLCLGYKGEFGLKREEYGKIKKSKTFDIIPKIGINEMEKYYKMVVKTEEERVKNNQEDNKDKMMKLFIEKGIKDILYVDFQSPYFNSFIIKLETMFNKNIDKKLLYGYIEKEYKTQLNDLNKILVKTLMKSKNSKTEDKNILEIGMGLGLYSLVLLKVVNKFKNTNLIISDLEQKSLWESDGIKYIEKEIEKKKDNYKFTQEDPLFLFPKLLKEKGKESLNIVLINKSYNFDRMVSYLEFINILLKKEGLIIIPKVVNRTNIEIDEYMKKNYNFMEKIDNKYYNIYKKIDNDERKIGDYNNF